MDTNKISNWVQIIASLGMMIGLVLVGLQMKQNEEILRIQIMSDYYTSYVEAESNFSLDHAKAYQKSVEEPENLTLTDMRLLEGQSFNPLLRWVNLYRLSQEGIVSEDAWKNQVTLDATFYFGTPWRRAWWNKESVLFEGILLPTELKNYIQSHLNDDNVYENFESYFSIKKRAVEYAKKRAAALGKQKLEK
jgi:hypothetical protein